MNTDDKITLVATGAFTRYLKGRRLRKTPERFIVLDKVMSMADHFVIESLHDAIEADGLHLSLGTVYNTIELLIDAGLVRRHTFGNATAQYEKVTSISGNHLHLVCSQCGRVKEARDPEITRILNSRRYSAFRSDYFDLNIYGICSRCQRKNRQSKSSSKK